MNLYKLRYVFGQNKYLYMNYQMNLKLQQTFPSPSIGLSTYNTLTYADDLGILVLLGDQKPQNHISTNDQPKKKIAFKPSNINNALVGLNISIFSILQRKWIVHETKGKHPMSRIDFSCIYLKPCVIVYGGRTNNKNQNDVYSLNCQTWTWKKLFSLDGPPSADKVNFFKISQVSAGLIVLGSLWILQVSNVKWQLSSNQLPGSVWQKTNIQLPQNIQFVWKVDNSVILIVGQNQAARVNLISKQKIGQFHVDKQIIQSQNFIQICQCNPIKQKIQKNNKMHSAYKISQNKIQKIIFSSNPKQQIQFFSDSQTMNATKLERPIKCCALIQTQTSTQIFYIDIKGQLILLHIQDDKDEQNKKQVEFRRLLQKNEQLSESNDVKNDSCICQQQNQQSSILVPSANSRVQAREFLGNEETFCNQKQYQSQKSVKKLNTQTKNEVFQYYSHDKEQDKDEEQKEIKIKENYKQNQIQQNWPIKRQKNSNIATNFNKLINIDHKIEKKGYASNEQVLDDCQSSSLNNPHISETFYLKQKLTKILFHQCIKRNLLQAKIQALQITIKKSEKFVLMLCKHGDNNEKLKHIQRVRNLRQSLQWDLTKQLYFRKQMGNNKMPSQISQQVFESMNYLYQ